MKNLFTAALIALTVSFTSLSVSAANNGPSDEQEMSTLVKVAHYQNSKVDVTVQSQVNQKMTIRVTDAFSNIISAIRFESSESGKRFRYNLADLTDGTYQISIWDGNTTLVKSIEVKTNFPLIQEFKDIAIL